MNSRFAYKLVAVDLDGTLFDGECRVMPRSAEALRRLADIGVQIAIASGRRLGPVTLEAAECIGRPVYLVLCNGAKVVAPDGKNQLLYRPVAPEDARWFIDTMCRRAKTYWLARDKEVDLLWKREDGAPNVPGISDDLLKLADSTEEIIAAAGADILRVRVWGSDEEILSACEIATRFGLTADGFNYPGGGDSYIEVTGKGVSKASALEFLAERLGIKMSEIMAFGDGSNDICMLRSVGHGVAMANAPDPVKSAARDVTASNHEEGVAEYIEKMLGYSTL